MNIERPTSNVEWEKMKKQIYDLEERLLEYSVRIIKNDVLEETEELIKIFVTSINTAEKKQK
jgi:purine nucleoside permease